MPKVLTACLILAISCVCIIGSADAATATSKVRFYMNMGLVEIELYGNESPLNVANFLSYVNSGAYNDSMIHRTRDGASVATSDLFVQGGSFKTNGVSITPGPPVNNEFNAANGLSNVQYTIAAARSTSPNSATSGWFINKTNNAGPFDAGPYTVFGKATVGFSIIDQIPLLNNLPILTGSSLESMPIYQNGEVIIQRALRIPTRAGDYDFNGTINAADYSLWRSNIGSTTNLAIDGNGNGVVDAADYAVWRNALSAGSGSGTAAANIAVPEPGTATITAVALLALTFRRRTRS
jgi:peptidyl-prolyl cis-trans isomerase A (cyclophilin A)